MPDIVPPFPTRSQGQDMATLFDPNRKRPQLSRQSRQLRPLLPPERRVPKPNPRHPVRPSRPGVKHRPKRDSGFAQPVLSGVEAAQLSGDLSTLAEHCRSFAEACDAAAKRLARSNSRSQTTRRLPTTPVNLTPMPDFLGVDLPDLDFAIADWEEDTEPTLVWKKTSENEESWDIPVSELMGSRATLPPRSPPCPSCGHRNGAQYRSCITCGRALQPDFQELTATDILEPQLTLGDRIVTWLRRVDPRRPRWLDPDVLARISVPPN